MIHMQNTKTKQTEQNYDIKTFVDRHMFVMKNLKEINSISDAWAFSARKYGSNIAFKDDYCKIRMTYKEAYAAMCNTAAALQSIGLKKFSHVAFFSENSCHWNSF